MSRLLVVLLVLAALAGGAAYLAFNYLDVVVKLALEHYGPEVTGVAVKVGEVQISPTSGRGAIRNLELGSPKGFGAARTARLGEVRLALDPATITSKVIVVQELTIEAPHITYERGSKTSNLDVIQNHIEAYVKQASSREAGQTAPGEASTRRKFIIRRLDIRGARVTMTNPALKGQGLSFDLPDVNLRDVGQRTNGVTASQAAAIVASELQKRIAQKVLTNVEALRRGGVEGAFDALKGLFR